MTLSFWYVYKYIVNIAHWHASMFVSEGTLSWLTLEDFHDRGAKKIGLSGPQCGGPRRDSLLAHDWAIGFEKNYWQNPQTSETMGFTGLGKIKVLINLNQALTSGIYYRNYHFDNGFLDLSKWWILCECAHLAFTSQKTNKMERTDDLVSRMSHAHSDLLLAAGDSLESTYVVAPVSVTELHFWGQCVYIYFF